MGRLRIVVLLGSRWASLQDQATRWREVVVRWADPDRDRDLDVILVDWPNLSVRAALRGRGHLVVAAPSWLPDVRLFAATMPMHVRPTPLDPLGWSRISGALRAAIGDDPIDLALSAHPLWNPVLPRLGATRTGFDAVDDWRGHPLAERASARIDGGYRAAADATVVTANSVPLAERLKSDYGLEAVAVPNGVDLHAFDHPAAPPGGLPEGPFAVYVGVVQERVDVDLLCAVAAGAGLPVVIAGPAPPPVAAALEQSGATVLGPVPHHEVPGLLRRAAVGLVPHRVNDFTASMDPMKLLEYLAAGLPVVTTALPGMSDLSPRVTVTSDTDGFVAAVRRAAGISRLECHDPAVDDRDWSVVADELLALHGGRVR